MSMLPRLTAFPILPEGHMVYKMSEALAMPSKEKYTSPLLGQAAPEIILQDQLGRDCSLHATIALGRPIVLFFFPLAGSPHCTLESCYFRDAMAESAVFADLDAIIIGISQDSPQTLRKFAAKHDLGYVILSDHQRTAMQTFGVTRTWMGLLNNRSTFIIDPNGIVRAQCDGVLAAAGHRDFAERWLIRIEDELVGREKSREAGDPGDDGTPMTSEQASSLKIKRGEENSDQGAGIGKAPRYGAAPIPQKVAAKASGRGLRAFVSRPGHSTTDLATGPEPDASANARSQSIEDTAAQADLNGSASGSGRRPASTKSNKKTLRRIFSSQRDLPPIPPTYQNLDEDYVQVYDGSHSLDGARLVAGAHSSRGSHSDIHSGASSTDGSHSHGTSHTSDSRHSQGAQSRTALASPLAQNKYADVSPTSVTPSMAKRIPVPDVSRVGLVEEQADLPERTSSSSAGWRSEGQSSSGDGISQAIASGDSALLGTAAERPTRNRKALIAEDAPGRRPRTAPTQTRPSGVVLPQELRASPSSSSMQRGVLTPSSLLPSSQEGPRAPMRSTSRADVASRPGRARLTSNSSATTPQASRPSTSDGRSSVEAVKFPGSSGTAAPFAGDVATVGVHRSRFGQDRWLGHAQTSLSPAPPARRAPRPEQAPQQRSVQGNLEPSGEERPRASSTSTVNSALSQSSVSPPLVPRESQDSLADAEVQIVRKVSIQRPPMSPKRVPSSRVRVVSPPQTMPNTAAGGDATPTNASGSTTPVLPSASKHASPVQIPTASFAGLATQAGNVADVTPAAQSAVPRRVAVPAYPAPPPLSSDHRFSTRSYGFEYKDGRSIGDDHDDDDDDDHDDRASTYTSTTNHPFNEGNPRRPSAGSVSSHDSRLTTDTFGF